MAEKITINNEDICALLNKVGNKKRNEASERKDEIFEDISISKQICEVLKAKEWVKNGKIVGILENCNLRIAVGTLNKLIIFKLSYLS